MESWSGFIAHCLHRRLTPDRFGKYAQQHHSRSPLSPNRLADVLLRPTEHDTECLDPLIPQYVQILLQADLIDVAAVLKGLLRYSTFQHNELQKATGEGGEEGDIERLRWNNSHVQEEALIYGMTKIVSSEARPKNENESLGLIVMLREWMEVLTIAAEHEVNVLHDLGTTSEGSGPEAVAVRIAFGTLLVATSENMRVLKVLRKGCPKGILKAFSASLASFAPQLLSTSQMLAERLEHFRTQTIVPLEPMSKKAAQVVSDEMDQMMEAGISGMNSIHVEDLPILNSRAGLYVYLSSMLVGQPIVDDHAILNYLNNRYQGDIQATCIDLILASFDILANAIFRKEKSKTTIVLRSFLINKLPLLLSTLSASMFPPLSAEFCITEALSHVDTNAFPTFSSMFDENSGDNPFGDSIRQDFCYACCLHGLIAEGSIEGLIGEIPMGGLPAGGRYTKEDLVQQCLTDHDRPESLLEELEHMDGNVGAVSQALTEILGQLCQTKETMSLKSLCSHLARKPSSMDIMLLFETPATILRPLCELLDGWQYDEDLGEYQPVYEEFGCILLLVLAFVYRYDLSAADMGIQAQDSFIAKLLVKGALSRQMSELTEAEKGHLDGWIRGLFNSEGGGLGDETMSTCPPQEFYLLVPTLFHQTVLACSTGHLNDEGLKGGLEFLVDTFLLPSLIGAITWLSSHLWESHNDSTSILTILQTLIQPPSISNEASLMLASILNIIASPLEHSLRYLQRSQPSRQDVDPLSKALKPHLGFERTAASDHTELESWTGGHGGSHIGSHGGGALVNSVRHMIQLLVQWSLTQGVNIMPTSYTHRLILVSLRLLGAKRLLNAIVTEVASQTVAGSGSVAMDIAIAMICAPDASNGSIQQNLTSMLQDPTSAPEGMQRRLGLKEALKTEADNENVMKRYKTDAEGAETVVRLWRRVEAQLHVPQGMPQSMLDPMDVDSAGLALNVNDASIGGVMLGEMNDGGLMEGGQAIDAAIAATANAVGDDMMGMDMDMGMGDMGNGDDMLGMDMKLDF